MKNQNLTKSCFEVKLFLLFMILLVAPAFAADHSIDTVAGPLAVRMVKDRCVLSLNSKDILKIDCFASFLPDFAQKFGNTGAFDQIVILQESPKGNACNGGPLHLIGLRRSKSAEVFGPIDFCGGRSPMFRQRKGSITITFPGGAPNIGSGYIPDEEWLFRDGKITRTK